MVKEYTFSLKPTLKHILKGTAFNVSPEMPAAILLLHQQYKISELKVFMQIFISHSFSCVL